MKTDNERISKLEERVGNMMSALRILQRQVILLTQLEQQRMETGDRSFSAGEVACAEVTPCMKKHPHFGDD